MLYVPTVSCTQWVQLLIDKKMFAYSGPLPPWPKHIPVFLGCACILAGQGWTNASTACHIGSARIYWSSMFPLRSRVSSIFFVAVVALVAYAQPLVSLI